MKSAIFSLALLAMLFPFSAAQAQKSLEQQAEALLDKALRPAPPQTQQNFATQAEELYKKAVAEMKNEAAKGKTDKDRREAKFKMGVLLMGQSRTYIDLSKDAVNQDRAKVIAEARATFAAVVAEHEKAKDKDKDLPALLYKCRAWLYKCGEDGDDAPLAKENLEKVMSAKSKDAEEAQSLVRYFRLGVGPKGKLGGLDRARAIQKDAEAWLKDYPAYQKTTIGFAVRFEQATALFGEAEFFTQKKKTLDKNIADTEEKIKNGKAEKSLKAIEIKELNTKLLAEKKERDALAKDAKVQADRYAKVQSICKVISESDNDYSEKARGLDAVITGRSVSDKTADDLSTFELCYVRAQQDMDKLGKLSAQIKEAPPDTRPALEKNRKTLFRNIAQTLNRGISLANAKTPANELDDARYDLLVSYMAIQDPFRTAIAGEAMSKTKPLTKKSAQAAGYAIQAYAEIVATDPSENNRNRLREMTAYVLTPECQQAWAKEPVSGVARFQLAMLLLTEVNQLAREEANLPDLSPERKQLQEKRAIVEKAGIEHLKLVPKEYPAYLYAQAKLVFVALDARDKAKKPEEKKEYLDLARKTLADLKQLPPNTDPSSANMYFHARMEETKLLYAEAADSTAKKDTVQARKLYQQMIALLAQLGKELQAAPQIGEERQGQLTYYMGTMQKYATLGLADFEYRGGNYDQVLALTGPVVDTVKKEFDAGKARHEVTAKKEHEAAKKKFDAAKGDPEAKKEFETAEREAAKPFVFEIKDFQVTGEVLGLALRASVQKGKIEEAKQILRVVGAFKGGALSESSNVMRNLVVELEVQIRELQKAGDRDKLKKTVGNFTDFLDALLAQSKNKALEKNDIFFLAKCYDSLDQHDKAAELYKLYPAPKFLDIKKKNDKDKWSDEEEKELQAYWYTQVQQARQLRLVTEAAKKKFEAAKADPEAKKELEAAEKKLPEAKKLLDALQKHENARQQLMAEKEQNHLLEDNGLYGTAITHWSQFMNNPGLKKNLATDAKIKNIYFDAYYHLAYCWYKYSQTDKVKKAGKDVQFLDKAVDYIIRLETAPNKEGWQIVEFRFRDLMQNEKVLSDAYKKKKAG